MGGIAALVATFFACILLLDPYEVSLGGGVLPFVGFVSILLIALVVGLVQEVEGKL